MDASIGIPYDDDTFDLVVCGEVIEHVIDTDKLIDEIKRVLAPGGTMILTTPNLAYGVNRMLLLVGVQPAFTETSLRQNRGRVFKWLGQGGATVGHLKVFTQRALREHIAASGLEIGRIEGYQFIDSGPLSVIDGIFRSITDLAAGFIVVATKPVASRPFLEPER